MEKQDKFATMLLALGPPAENLYYDVHPTNPYGLRLSKRNNLSAHKYRRRAKEMIHALFPRERGKTRIFVEYIRWMAASTDLDIRPLRERSVPSKHTQVSPTSGA
jgi:hypothetical protein